MVTRTRMHKAGGESGGLDKARLRKLIAGWKKDINDLNTRIVNKELQPNAGEVLPFDEWREGETYAYDMGSTNALGNVIEKLEGEI